jgi:hypothetical protein
MMQAMRVAVVFVALCGGLLAASGCASQQRQAAAIDEDASIERPAMPLDEETGLADRIGEVGVVLLIIAVTVGGILVPLLLL